MSGITDVRYEAIEPKFKRLRLAHDTNGNVYIMDNSIPAYSVPFSMALLGEIYNEKMESYRMNELELHWVNRMKQFANELGCFHKGNSIHD